MKLDTGILDSSLWVEAAEVRIVFITVLAMCGPDGLCPATAPGISRRANLSLARTRAALARLEAPDAESRSLTAEGRRLQRVDGGYRVVNYVRYREKDHTATERKRRERDRKRGVSRVTSRLVTQAEAEGEAEEHERTSARSAAEGRSAPIAQPKQYEANGNGNDAKKATTRQRPGWVSLAGDALRERRGGEGDYGRIGKELAPLVKQHGEAEVLARWRRYIDGPSYYGPHPFAVDFGKWAAGVVIRAEGRRQSSGEATMAAVARVRARHEGSDR